MKGQGLAALALLLLPLAAAAGPGPDYRWDESRNRPAANRCRSDSQCDGARTCSPSGWCQGDARPLPPPPPPPRTDRGPGRGPPDRGPDRGPPDRAPDWKPGRGETRPQRATFIRSRLNGLVVDVAGNNRAPGAGLIAHRAKSFQEGNDNQQWELVPAPGGYLIRSRLNGLVLDINGGNKSPGAQVITWEAHGGSNQVWQLVPSNRPGYYFLQSQLNGFVLDIKGGVADGSGQLILYPRHPQGSDNQLWQLDL